MRLRQLLGDNIRRARVRADVSQEALAEHAKIHRTHMGAIERGETNVSIDIIERICTALGIAPDELFRLHLIRPRRGP